MITPVQLEAIASQSVGTPTTIVCQNREQMQVNYTALGETLGDGVLGFVIFHNGVPIYRIHMLKRECNALYHLNQSPPVNPRISYGVQLVDGKVADPVGGEAISVFAHEIEHLAAQSQDEAWVECTSYKNAWQVLKLFKLASWKVPQVLRGVKMSHFNSDPVYLKDC